MRRGGEGVTERQPTTAVNTAVSEWSVRKFETGPQLNNFLPVGFDADFLETTFACAPRRPGSSSDDDEGPPDSEPSAAPSLTAASAPASAGGGSPAACASPCGRSSVRGPDSGASSGRRAASEARALASKAKGYPALDASRYLQLLAKQKGPATGVLDSSAVGAAGSVQQARAGGAAASAGGESDQLPPGVRGAFLGQPMPGG